MDRPGEGALVLPGPCQCYYMSASLPRHKALSLCLMEGCLWDRGWDACSMAIVPLEIGGGLVLGESGVERKLTC